MWVYMICFALCAGFDDSQEMKFEQIFRNNLFLSGMLEFQEGMQTALNSEKYIILWHRDPVVCMRVHCSQRFRIITSDYLNGHQYGRYINDVIYTMIKNELSELNKISDNENLKRDYRKKIELICRHKSRDNHLSILSSIIYISITPPVELFFTETHIMPPSKSGSSDKYVP